MIGSALLMAVNVIFQVAALAILARVILSWLPMAGVRIDPYHPLIRFLYQITDPILEPIRRFATFGMMDFSPVVALILLEIVRRVLVAALLGSFR
ncbi:MAG: YggT family protein [Anaerolineae bacterium]